MKKSITVICRILFFGALFFLAFFFVLFVRCNYLIGRKGSEPFEYWMEYFYRGIELKNWMYVNLKWPLIISSLYSGVYWIIYSVGHKKSSEE